MVAKVKTTTIEIYLDCLPWWRNCCKVKGKNSRDCFKELKEKVNLKKQAELYNSLPRPQNGRLPLLGKHVDKSKFVKKL